MALPRSVEEQDRQADEMQQRMYGKPKDENDNRDPGNESDVTRAPDGAASDTSTQTPAASERTGDDPEYWRRRFETLQGKYNAEVRQVARENEQLQQKLETAASNAADLRQQVKEFEQQAPIDVSKHFSQDERDQFGDETLAMMHRHANAVADERARQVREEMSGQVEQVRETQQQTRAERFVSDLEHAVPNWETINADPAFHRWLEQTVPVHTTDGRQNLARQTLLSQYEKAGNARDVIALFREFENAQEGERKQQARREAPPKATGGRTPPAGDDRATITEADIADFYNNEAEYRRNDPKAAAAREAEIERAMRENRVRTT